MFINELRVQCGVYDTSDLWYALCLYKSLIDAFWHGVFKSRLRYFQQIYSLTKKLSSSEIKTVDTLDL